jgi:hypothetical protein
MFSEDNFEWNARHVPTKAKLITPHARKDVSKFYFKFEYIFLSCSLFHIER